MDEEVLKNLILRYKAYKKVENKIRLTVNSKLVLMLFHEIPATKWS